MRLVDILGYNSKGDMILYNGDKEIKIEVKDESYSYESLLFSSFTLSLSMI